MESNAFISPPVGVWFSAYDVSVFFIFKNIFPIFQSSVLLVTLAVLVCQGSFCSACDCVIGAGLAAGNGLQAPYGFNHMENKLGTYSRRAAMQAFGWFIANTTKHCLSSHTFVICLSELRSGCVRLQVLVSVHTHLSFLRACFF